MFSQQVVGRDKEINLLESIGYSNRAEFVAVYGRRRVGKTYLIHQTFSNHSDLIYFKVTGAKDAPMTEQIKHFTQEISRVFYQGVALQEQQNWDEAFNLLTTTINRQESSKNIILFFDELPWMATNNSRLLQTLEYYWNQYWSHQTRIKLIVCGSSAAWIVDKIINSKGGLHNRITCKLRLKPLNLSETAKFLHAQQVKLTRQQITQLYMVTGGIPYYLSRMQANKSAAQLIDEHAFSEDGFLFDEFEKIFVSLFEDAASHVELLRLIASSRSGLSHSQIFEQSKQQKSGGRLTEQLNALKEAGFITALTPFQHRRKGTYYQVIDEYCLFYLHWIEPLKGRLSSKSLSDSYWQSQQGSQQWHAWAGYAFEAICYKHIDQISKKLLIPGGSTAASWRYTPLKKSSEEGAQIDLLFDRPDDAITFCEIKYTKEAFYLNKQQLESLQRKARVFAQKTRSKKQAFLALISANGIKQNDYAKDNLAGEVTLEDFFDA